MKYNKRGLSPIIATVLVIMISIAAIAALAGFLVPFVRNSLQKSTECIAYGSYYVFDDSFNYNCKNIEENDYLISVKASFDRELADNIEGMKVVFKKENGESKVLEIKDNFASSTSEEEISIVGETNPNLRLPGPGGIVTYSYHALSGEEFSGAEVYPILEGGRICADTPESINIKPC